MKKETALKSKSLKTHLKKSWNCKNALVPSPAILLRLRLREWGGGGGGRDGYGKN